MDDQVFNSRLLTIQSDRSSGAAELARRCLEIVAESSLQDNSDSTSVLLHKLNIRADLLARSRSSMAPIANLLHLFQKDIEKFRDLPPEEAREKCGDSAGHIIMASIKATEKTAENAAKLIGKDKTVFTHSYSSTIMQIFSLLAGKDLRVIVSESRPLYEGYRAAEKLSDLKIPTTLITDAQSGLFIKKADFVLVGADTLLQDYSVLNKVGTYPAALVAYDNNIPFYVCSEKYKQIHSSSKTPELEAMSGAELNAPDLPFVSIENIYFDITPVKLITGWINEDGVVPVGRD